jgi:hypothetical protein
VLSGALKIADKVTVAMEAVENKIRVNSQGWEDARIIGERQVPTGHRAIISSHCCTSTISQQFRALSAVPKVRRR